MFNIGPGELIVILILALVLLGPEKLPEMARTVGKGMRELRRATEDLKDQVESEFYKLDENKPVVKPPEGPRYPKTTPAIALPPALASSTSAAAPTDPAFPATQPDASPPVALASPPVAPAPVPAEVALASPPVAPAPVPAEVAPASPPESPDPSPSAPTEAPRDPSKLV